MDKEGWNNRINTLFRCNYERAKPFKTEFEECALKEIKVTNHTDSGMILLCVVKDDLLRLKKFMDHYRMLGITHFVFVDNMSTDGTREFLVGQEDSDVYECNQTYSSLRRVVWLNKLISIYGTDYWYIMVDSDEFIFYPQMENYPLANLIRFAEHKGICRISGYLVDMYSKGDLFGIESNEDFFERMVYYDGCGYDIHNTCYGLSIKGGPRRRVFHADNELAKCPVFKLGNEDIVASAHFLLPRIKAKDNPIWFVLGHYKFINSNDRKRIDDAVLYQNYAAGSYDYKIYKKGVDDLNIKTFYSESVSAEVGNSLAFSKMPFLEFPNGRLYEDEKL